MTEEFFIYRQQNYFRLANADGKVWIIPRRAIAMGLELYQPSGWKGKMMKSLLPLLSRMPFLLKLLHIDVVNIDIPLEVRKEIEKVFGIKEFLFSVFMGTPCAHQKVTIQVYTKEGGILGYCKLTDNPNVWINFQKEYRLLDELKAEGINEIPEGLSCQEIKKGEYLFIQSTVKTRHSQYPHGWSEVHNQFMRELYDKTCREMVYEQTDFYRQIKLLEERLDWLVSMRPTIEEAIKYVNALFQGKEIGVSAYHADFTPWNMFVENGRLFVFDWEYALMTCPPGLDRYHFFVQTEIFEKCHGTEEIWQSFLQTSLDKQSFLEYLLLNMSIYIGRESKETLNLQYRKFELWTILIDKILKST